MNQKIPLFGGLIAGIPVGAGPQTVFTPPDKDSDAPGIYELHLFVAQAEDEGVVVSVYEGTNAAAAVPAWIGQSNADARYNPIAKPLDGFPVRGDVTVQITALDKGGNDTVFAWGYYFRVGQGPQQQAERRPIGQALEPFNAGVPFRIAADGGSQIIHTFEPTKFDEMSLALLHAVGALDTREVTLDFEDVDHNVLATAKLRPFAATAYYSAAAAVALPPFGGSFPPSPYQIYQCPFGVGGGGPVPRFLRVTNDAGNDAELLVHGYFTRR